ncbi:MAG: hypothetical protein EXR95_11260, partial [Gemmatimonadetes bacterium]|nr:hypothetical protein [Gemmatimonadota bacterium]
MSRTALILATALLALGASASTASAQDTISIPEAQRAKKLPRQQLSGTRLGFTTFTGDVAHLRERAGLEPIITQFGWQWETQIVSQTGGGQALMEWVLLAGGRAQPVARLVDRV